jgi:hypothetical protein
MISKKAVIKVPATYAKNTLFPTVRVPARFTIDTERFHGRLAMVGLTGSAIMEHIGYKLPVMQQITTELGVSFMTVAGVVTIITSAILLETINPQTERVEEQVPQVWSKPGFSVETEILHGRLAMLAFAYTLIAENFTSTVL